MDTTVNLNAFQTSLKAVDKRVADLMRLKLIKIINVQKEEARLTLEMMTDLKALFSNQDRSETKIGNDFVAIVGKIMDYNAEKEKYVSMLPD